MAEIFARYPGVVARTVEIADECAFNLRLAKPRLPKLQVPDGHTPISWLRELTRRGADQRYAHIRDDGGGAAAQGAARSSRRRTSPATS